MTTATRGPVRALCVAPPPAGPEGGRRALLLAVESLSDDLLELADRAVRAEADRDAWKLIAHEAIQALARLTRTHEGLEKQKVALVAEYKQFRARLIGAAPPEDV